ALVTRQTDSVRATDRATDFTEVRSKEILTEEPMQISLCRQGKKSKTLVSIQNDTESKAGSGCL
ncbi:MAG: hypothetical protein NZL98_05615, partial [Anaerolineales bacterium]|nr:hypothetical protein [Anaerolineales bacterium]MDW8226338.1 hypothetical protein [Anaerolineales bacterium]